jgi:hypothetical protein
MTSNVGAPGKNGLSAVQNNHHNPISAVEHEILHGKRQKLMWQRSLARCWLQLEDDKSIISGLALSLRFLPRLQFQAAFSSVTGATVPEHTAGGLQAESIPTSLPTYTVWGANTGVGKTLASIGLAYAARRNEVGAQQLQVHASLVDRSIILLYSTLGCNCLMRRCTCCT